MKISVEAKELLNILRPTERAIIFSLSEGSKTFYGLTVKEKRSNGSVLAGIARLEALGLLTKGEKGKRNRIPLCLSSEGKTLVFITQEDER